MAFTVTGAVSGTPQTGFTTPGYTIVTDNAPDIRSKQSAVSALTGTQAGVNVHSVNAPFTVTVRRPSLLKTIAASVLNGVTGQYTKVPSNEYLVLSRKACQVALNQWFINEMRTSVKIYAGTETYDSPNVRALASFHIGYLNGNSSGLGDTLVTGIL